MKNKRYLIRASHYNQEAVRFDYFVKFFDNKSGAEKELKRQIRINQQNMFMFSNDEAEIKLIEMYS